MPHIKLAEELPGIRSLFHFRPETAEPLCRLADVLLHQPGSLSPAERELIATFVSSLNDCYYCQTAHGAIAAHHLNGGGEVVTQVKRDFKNAPVSDKLKSLLVIAGAVQKGGKQVTSSDVENARRARQPLPKTAITASPRTSEAKQKSPEIASVPEPPRVLNA